MRTRHLCAVLGIWVIASVAVAADWPQFQGPDRTGVSAEKDIASTWPQGGPPVKWTLDVGQGFGGAAISNGQVIFLDRGEDNTDILRVLDLKSGKEQWRFAYEAKGQLSHPGSRSVPTVEGDMIYTVGGFGDVYCVDRKSHKPVWNMNLNKAYTEAPLKWGFAQSPLIYKDTLIVSPASEKSPALVALDKKTGKMKWEAENYGGDYYTSPMLETVNGVQGILMLFSDKMLLFVEPATGKTIWKYDGYKVSWAIPAPVVMPDGHHIFITGGYDAGSVMIDVKKNGDDYQISEQFRLPDGSQIHRPILYKDHLYANINTNTTLKRDNMKNGGVACIDPAAGKIVWRSGENPNFDRGNVILVDNKLIILDGQNGQIAMAVPAPDKYTEIARAKVFDLKRDRGNDIWAPMALTDGLLVVRSQSQMKCLDIRSGSTASAE
ncbi:MAG: PQQ-binding-like beta-propeller repeat protein [Planctomycetes bacterium]|nr:PQQ-binding-like beta-propeller repeat protein [Planctomycetota bacterium]